MEGSIHEIEEIKQKDEQRQLEQQGLTFLRFTNNQIKQPEEVIQQIEEYLQSKSKLL